MIDYYHSSGNSYLFQIELKYLWISEQIVLHPCCNQFCWVWINIWLFVYFFVYNSHLNLKRTRLRHWWFCCMYLCLPKIINPMYNVKLRELFSPPRQNIVGVCKQITVLTFYYIRYRLVTLLKIIDAPTQVSDIFYLSLSYKFINLAFKYSFFLFLKYLLASRLTLFRLSTLFWFGSRNNCLLAYFLLSKTPKHSSSNHVLCCFNSYRTRLCFAEVLISL